MEVPMLPWHRSVAVAAFAVVLALDFAVSPAADAAAKKKEAIPESDPFGRLTADQVERRLGRPNVHVVDGNTPETYVENHLPGAVNLNHKDITTAVLPKDKDATLIFYCMNEL